MKKILIAITIVLSTFDLYAQEAKVLFGNMPEAVLPLLSSVNRADFIDFLESNMKAVVKNKFDGTSEMTDLGDNYIRIKVSGNSTWEMKVLPVNDSTKVICVVSTACAPVCDSHIEFYTASWKKIPLSDYIELPVLNDYFQLVDSTRLDDYTLYLQKMDMLLATATLLKDSDTLAFALTTPEYVSQQSSTEEKPLEDTAAFLHKPLVYLWSNDPETGTYRFRKEDVSN